MDSSASSRSKVGLVVWVKNSGIEAMVSEFPECFWKALERRCFCEVLGAESLWWVFVLDWQVTECCKLLDADGRAWSHIVHLSAWLDAWGSACSSFSEWLILWDCNVACISSASHVLSASVSDSLSLFLLLCLFFPLTCVYTCVYICFCVYACVCAHDCGVSCELIFACLYFSLLF